MSDSDDDIPELEDMSAQVEARKSQLESSRFKRAGAPAAASDRAPKPAPPKPKPQFKKGDRVSVKGLKGAPQHNGKAGTILRFNEAKGRYEVELDGGKPLALRPANLEEKPSSGLEGLAGGFKNRPTPAQEARPPQPEPKEDDIIRPTGNKEDALKFSEVQEALTRAKADQSWMTEDFLKLLLTDPYYATALKDPRLQAAMGEIAEDPAAALKKYAGNTMLEGFIKKFMGTMGTQMTKVAEMKAKEDEEKRQAEEAKRKAEEKERLARGELVDFGGRLVEKKDLDRWMTNPQLLQVFNDPATGRMLQHIGEDSGHFGKYQNLPAIRLMVKEGVLLVPPQFQ